MKTAAVLAFVVFAVAGCGSTRVVTKTRLVHPCSTAAAMSECVRLLVNQYRDSASITVRTRCKPAPAAGQWSCVVLVDDAVTGGTCGRITAELLGPGVLFPASDVIIQQSVCDETFGKS